MPQAFYVPGHRAKHSTQISFLRHSCNESSLSISYVSSTVPGTGERAVNKINEHPALMELTFAQTVTSKLIHDQLIPEVTAVKTETGGVVECGCSPNPRGPQQLSVRNGMSAESLTMK